MIFAESMIREGGPIFRQFESEFNHKKAINKNNLTLPHRIVFDDRYPELTQTVVWTEPEKAQGLIERFNGPIYKSFDGGFNLEMDIMHLNKPREGSAQTGGDSWICRIMETERYFLMMTEVVDNLTSYDLSKWQRRIEEGWSEDMLPALRKLWPGKKEEWLKEIASRPDTLAQQVTRELARRNGFSPLMHHDPEHNYFGLHEKLLRAVETSNLRNDGGFGIWSIGEEVLEQLISEMRWGDLTSARNYLHYPLSALELDDDEWNVTGPYVVTAQLIDKTPIRDDNGVKVLRKATRMERSMADIVYVESLRDMPGYLNDLEANVGLSFPNPFIFGGHAEANANAYVDKLIAQYVPREEQAHYVSQKAGLIYGVWGSNGGAIEVMHEVSYIYSNWEMIANEGMVSDGGLPVNIARRKEDDDQEVDLAPFGRKGHSIIMEDVLRQLMKLREDKCEVLETFGRTESGEFADDALIMINYLTGDLSKLL